MTMQLLIYGASGFGREVEWLINDWNEGEYRIIGYVDDDSAKQGGVIHNLPVMSLEEAAQLEPRPRIVSGVGSPKIRFKCMERARLAGFEAAPAIVHYGTLRSHYVTVGMGSVLCAGNILTTEISIGQHAQINLGCTIGHDVVIEDYVTLAPGVHISGNVHIEAGAFLGTGAVILNGEPGRPLRIGRGAVVGAAACVTKDVPPEVVMVGMAARPIKR